MVHSFLNNLSACHFYKRSCDDSDSDDTHDNGKDKDKDNHKGRG